MDFSAGLDFNVEWPASSDGVSNGHLVDLPNEGVVEETLILGGSLLLIVLNPDGEAIDGDLEILARRQAGWGCLNV